MFFFHNCHYFWEDIEKDYYCSSVQHGNDGKILLVNNKKTVYLVIAQTGSQEDFYMLTQYTFQTYRQYQHGQQSCMVSCNLFPHIWTKVDKKKLSKDLYSPRRKTAVSGLLEWKYTCLRQGPPHQVTVTNDVRLMAKMRREASIGSLLQIISAGSASRMGSVQQ